MNQTIKKLIDALPNNPGCYQMYNKDNEVIYVGKAKNLYKRVSQYFLRPQSGKVQAMVSNVDHFDFIITSNESEAFILEYNLIHKYLPKYNILLKDDKHYPYIGLKKRGIIEVKLKRNLKDKNYSYFGPYPKSTFAYDIIDLINKLFPLKKCNVLPKKPCLYYHINQCLGYCVKKIDDAINDELYSKVYKFLKGNTKEIEDNLIAKIKENNEKLNFEESKFYKELLDAINHIKTLQTVDFNSNENKDFFAYTSFNNYVCIALFVYRNGMLLGKDEIISEIFENELETVSDLITQYYAKNELPKEIIVFSKDLKNSLQDYLNCKIISPTKGKNFDVLNKLIENSKKGLEKYFNKEKSTRDVESILQHLQNLLHIKYPKYIELFDNSHISGYDAVSVSVAYVNGIACKRLYRKFKLNNENTKSDLDNMKEVLTRKYKRMLNDGIELPNLILIDGGLNQIVVAKNVLNNLNIKNIDIFGLYKNDKHQTEGIISLDGNKIPLDKKSDLYLFLSSMQDEVHRFAITFFRQTHLKNYKKSILDGIEGLGKVKKNLIYETYPDLNSLKQASLLELEQFLNKKVALNLYNKIHQDD